MILRSVLNHKPQQGAVLIVFLLILILGSASVLLNKLNANAINRENVEQTYQALNKAKQALISFALTVPERSTASPRPGPGYLPCPDTDNDGDAEGGCGVNAIGRIPYETLEEDVLMDDSGEVLWYALSDNFRNIGARFTPLNSDTAGQLTLDGRGDVVALIFAPGPPVGNQQRNVNPNLLTNYLENDNATNGDNSFISFLLNDNPPTFNDRVIAITRQELMEVVEKRVLNEVSLSMGNYRNSFGAGNQAYPWLSAFNLSPIASMFRGTVSTWQGHLPFHWAADPNSVQNGGAVVGRNPFSTGVTVSWNNIVGADEFLFSGFGFNTVSSACLRDITNCDAGGVFPAMASLSSAANINCTWVNINTANCVQFTVVMPSVPIVSGSCPAGQLTRTYTITFPQFTGISNINSPTTVANRTRGVTLAAANPNFIPAQVNAIRIVDTYSGFVSLLGICVFGPLVNAPVSAGLSTFNAGAVTGTIAINNMNFDIDMDGIDNNGDGDYVDAGEIAPELPNWFVRNNWHHLVNIAYSANEPLPGALNAAIPLGGAGGVCTAGANCLTLTANNGANVVNNNIRALAIMAGRDLSAIASPRPNNLPGDYFDLLNSDGNVTGFDTQLFNNAFNDQIRVIGTTAVP